MVEGFNLIIDTSSVIVETVTDYGLKLDKDEYKLSNGSIITQEFITSIQKNHNSFVVSKIYILTLKDITTIEKNAFSGCESLELLNLPDTLTSIEESAFSGCINLDSLKLPNTLTSIGNYAFYNCYLLESLTSLGSLTLPDTLKSIGAYAFWGCKHLTSLTLPNTNTLTSIGAHAFSGCKHLTSLTLPNTNTLTSIGEYAFSECPSLRSLTLPDSLISIGEYAFSSCSSLELLTLPNTLTRIESGVFFHCTVLTSLTLPNTITSIGESAFVRCHLLNQLFLPNKLTSIGEYAFWGCESLTELTLPDTLTSIGRYAFRYCESLTELKIPDTVTSIGESAFWGCKSLTELTLPDKNTLTSIEFSAFRGCESLRSLTLPYTITSINRYAFSDCSNLTSLTLPDSLTNIEDKAFLNCKNLTSLTLPDSLISIDRYAFQNSYKLKRLTFPKRPITIYDYAFSNSGIEVLYFPEKKIRGNDRIHSSAFNGHKIRCIVDNNYNRTHPLLENHEEKKYINRNANASRFNQIQNTLYTPIQLKDIENIDSHKKNISQNTDVIVKEIAIVDTSQYVDIYQIELKEQQMSLIQPIADRKDYYKYEQYYFNPKDFDLNYTTLLVKSNKMISDLSYIFKDITITYTKNSIPTYDFDPIIINKTIHKSLGYLKENVNDNDNVENQDNTESTNILSSNNYFNDNSNQYIVPEVFRNNDIQSFSPGSKSLLNTITFEDQIIIKEKIYDGSNNTIYVDNKITHSIFTFDPDKIKNHRREVTIKNLTIILQFDVDVVSSEIIDNSMTSLICDDTFTKITFQNLNIQIRGMGHTVLYDSFITSSRKNIYFDDVSFSITNIEVKTNNGDGLLIKKNSSNIHFNNFTFEDNTNDNVYNLQDTGLLIGSECNYGYFKDITFNHKINIIGNNVSCIFGPNSKNITCDNIKLVDINIIGSYNGSIGPSYCKDLLITNVNIENGNIGWDDNTDTNSSYCGGVLGSHIYGSNNIEKCNIKCAVKSHDSGGIIGSYINKKNGNTTIKKCSYKSTILGKNSGGIIGNNCGNYQTGDFAIEIDDCICYVDLSGDYSGGICGPKQLNMLISFCKIYGEIQNFNCASIKSDAGLNAGSNAQENIIQEKTTSYDNIYIYNCFSYATFNFNNLLIKEKEKTPDPYITILFRDEKNMTEIVECYAKYVKETFDILQYTDSTTLNENVKLEYNKYVDLHIRFYNKIIQNNRLIKEITNDNDNEKYDIRKENIKTLFDKIKSKGKGDIVEFMLLNNLNYINKEI